MELLSVVARPIETLLLSGKCNKLNVLPELNALARNDTSNAEQRSRARAVVVAARRTDPAKGAATVVVCADEDGVGGVLRALIRAVSASSFSGSIRSGKERKY